MLYGKGLEDWSHHLRQGEALTAIGYCKCNVMKRESEVVDLEHDVLADGNAVAQKIDRSNIAHACQMGLKRSSFGDTYCRSKKRNN
jgi:hypothetical protein